MLYLESRRLGRTTVVGFLSLALLIFAQGIYGVWRLDRLNDKLAHTLVSLSDIQVDGLTLQIRLANMRKLEKDLLLSGSQRVAFEAAHTRWRAEVKAVRAQVVRLQEEFKERGGPFMVSVEDLVAALNRYEDGIQEVVVDMRKPKEALTRSAQLKLQIQQIDVILAELLEEAGAEKRATLTNLETEHNDVLNNLAITGALTLLAGMVLSASVVRRSLVISRALEHQALHDTLTGVLNRRGMSVRMVQSTTRGGVLAYVDLDRFKLINDLCGHASGDELLMSLSRQLSALCESRQCTFARFGGDEFVIWRNGDTEIGPMREVASEVVRLVEAHHFEWLGQRMELGVSVGLALAKAHFEFTEVISRAEAACRLAKMPGSAKVLVYEESDPALVEARRQEVWALKLPQLLQGGRFCLFGQRVVPLRAGGTGSHVEVLLRGINEDGTYISPGVFLPAAERFGLMSRVDRWVVETLLASDLDSGTNYAVNLSAQTLADQSYLPTLLGLVSASGKAHQLTFEITESAAMTSIDTALQYIQSLKALGCRFSLDDFGSGFSSFAYLRDLKVDYLKIDGSLVRVIDRSETDSALVEAIIHMANALGLQTVAEFVETRAAADRLCEMGVDFGQGYGLHKPEPLDALVMAPPAG